MRHHSPRTRRQHVTRYPARPYRVSRAASVAIGLAALLALLFMMSF